ncbi:MAG TPA: Lrp/AsnC family transcriptional regulator [Gammaproteobacteria bacterium]|nr:Lrp/AsnC family transcriptional regulator [Gammaproteobacteria bacterium]
MDDPRSRSTIRDIDRAIVLATQDGLPLVPRPYHEVAERIGVSPDEVMTRLRGMVEAGAVRRIAAVPNHYALGYRANGMSVWDVDDDRVGALGREVGALKFVSHCYLRPRRPPHWRYNLFAMVHGRDRRAVEEKVARIARLLAPHVRAHEVLYSSRILKKTGLRLA